MPPDWVAAVLDQEGTIIARTRAADRFVGTKALPQMWERIQAQHGASGYVDGETKEREPASLAFARSAQRLQPIAGWRK